MLRAWLIYKKEIVLTVVICAIVFIFYHQYVLDLKNKQINVRDEKIVTLEKRLADYQQYREVEQTLKKLESTVNDRLSFFERKLLPLFVAWDIDPLTGYSTTGGFQTPSKITGKLTEAWSHVNNQQYDLALKRAEEIESIVPGFAGALMLRFRVAKEQGKLDEAMKYAAEMVKQLPPEKQVRDVFIFQMTQHTLLGHKKEAEEYGLKALVFWPDDELLRQFFSQNFGYLPKEAQEKQKELEVLRAKQKQVNVHMQVPNGVVP